MTRRLVAICCAVAVSSISLFAISGSTPVAWHGKPVLKDSGWPGGALELINDPARTEGWNPWFSGWPSDVNYYLFKVSDSNDINRLVKLLAAIQTNVYLKLNAASEAGPLAFTTVMKAGNGQAAVFSLGNQRMLNEWRAGLATKAGGPGAKPTSAFPPTLTLYVGHPSIDLGNLHIPAHVQVSADVPASVRKEKMDDALIQAIDTFIRKRNEK